MLSSNIWELCEHGGTIRRVYIVCGSLGERGMEPESCIGRVLSSGRSWLGLVAGAGPWHSLAGHHAGSPDWGQCDMNTEYAASTGQLITPSGPDNSLQLESD